MAKPFIGYIINIIWKAGKFLGGITMDNGKEEYF